MELQRGMRDKLDKYLKLNEVIDVQMGIGGPGVYDFCCFGVDAADKLSDDRYMIFYNQTISPQNEIVYTNSGNNASFRINLNSLPMSIQKLVFTVSIDGSSTMGNIYNFSLGVNQNGNRALNLSMSGSDFQQEKAIIAVEVYRKDTWRINTIARGFNGGLSDLLKNYGGEEVDNPSGNNNQNPVNPNPYGNNYQNPVNPNPYGNNYQNPVNPNPYGNNYQNPVNPNPYGNNFQPQQPVQPQPVQQQPIQPQPVQQQPIQPQQPVQPQPVQRQPIQPQQPQKVNLQKGQKVSLVKGSNGLGEVLINLNWKQPKGLFAKPIDLDLACLYELKDGSKGVVQALGKQFGSLNEKPYIALDGDDRSGASANGENIRINGRMVSKIKRILIKIWIYLRWYS